MANLLLHSMAEFTPLIISLLDKVNAKITFEVGVEYGLLSPALINRAEAIGGHHVGIDPSAKEGAENCFTAACAELFAETSAECLPKLIAADAYLIDGDHNYYTVLLELLAIRNAVQRENKKFPLVVLHDVAWPCARRDQYYNPANIPEEYRHPFSYDLGVRPGRPNVGPGGFRGAGAFAYAVSEGGPCNGVLTAIEDFIHDTPGLKLSIIPCIFGLGILTTEDMAEKLEPLIAPYRDNPVLAQMERNRLDLFIRVLDHQDSLI